MLPIFSVGLPLLVAILAGEGVKATAWCVNILPMSDLWTNTPIAMRRTPARIPHHAVVNMVSAALTMYVTPNSQWAEAD
jgi:hypothetical protein